MIGCRNPQDLFDNMLQEVAHLAASECEYICMFVLPKHRSPNQGHQPFLSSTLSE